MIKLGLSRAPGRQRMTAIVYKINATVLTLLSMLSCQAAANEPVARVEIEPAQVVVGTPARLRVTVLVPTFFSEASRYPSFEQPNLVVRLPANSSFNLSELIDGHTYSGIARDYEIYAQRAGQFTVGGGDIQVTFSDPQTQQPLSRKLTLETVELTGTVPAEAADLNPFLSSTNLTLEQTVGGTDRTLEPGAAITRTLTLTARGLPAMFLPPLLGGQVASGLRPYPAIAKTEDMTGQRGAPGSGRRQESVTYVVQSAGSYELPEVTLRWWNSKKQTIETATAVAVAFEVNPTPGTDQTLAGTGHGRQRYSPTVRFMMGVAAALLTTLLGVALWPRSRLAVMAWWSGAVERRRTSEAGRYAALRKAIARASLREVRESLRAWVVAACAQPPGPAGLLDGLPPEVADDPAIKEFVRLSTALDLKLFSNQPTDFEPERRRELLRAVRKARPVLRGYSKQAAAAPGLTPLNPVD